MVVSFRTNPVNAGSTCGHKGMEGLVSDTELECLNAWRNGNQVAGQRLYERYQPELRRFFANKALAEQVDDLCQKTWLAVVEVQSKGAGGPKPLTVSVRGYIFAFARYTLLRHYRMLAQRRRREFDPEVDSIEAMLPSLSRQLSLQRRIERLDLALQSLPLDRQLLMEARYVQELCCAELAEIFAVPEGTIRSRMAHARRQLDQKLTELGVKDGP